MRVVVLKILTVATLLGVAAVTATSPPEVNYVLKCPGCNAIIAAALSPDRGSVVVGGTVAFALLDRAKANWSWDMNFVDYGSEQEGPFAFASNDMLAGMAPNSGTLQTLWAVNASNGNNTWSAYDDGSLDQSALTGVPGAFISGAITSQSISRYDAKTGKKQWAVDLNDFIFNVASGVLVRPNHTHQPVVAGQFGEPTGDQWGIAVAYGNVAAVYSADEGHLVWNQTLPTQAATVAIDDVTGAVYFTGSNDPDGNALAYSTVFAFDWHTGAPLWSRNVSVLALSTALTARGRVVLASTTNQIVAFDAKNGHQLWTWVVGTPSANAVPVATLGVWNKTEVAFVSRAGTDLTCIHAATNATLWQLTLPNSLVATLSPIIADDELILFAATSDSNHGFVASVTVGGQ